MTAVRLGISTLNAALIAWSLTGCASTPPPAAEPPGGEHGGDEDLAVASGAELSATEVVNHLRGNETELRRCFFANPSLRGTARFAWKLDVSGKVHGMRRESSTLGDPRVETCLAERIAEIRFAEQDQPTNARWTFVFRLVEPPAKLKHGHKPSRKKKSALPDDDRGLVIDPHSAGLLPEGAIDNVVEAGYPLFARCFRDGVSRNNDLDGTVRLHFVVGDAGAVSEVSDGGSDLSDRQVVDCIAEGFYALRFPQPQHGTVQVLYRIGFDAG